MANASGSEKIPHYEHSECDKRGTRDDRLADESFLEAYNRNLVFMYYKWKKSERPDKKYKLIPSERTKFLNEYKKVVSKEPEEIIKTLFGMSEDNFNEEFRNFEFNYGKRILNQDTERQRCATSMAGDFGRLHSVIMKEILDKRQFQYWIDSESFICSSSIHEINPNCITITNDIDHYSQAKNYHSQNYIVVDSKYIPRNTDSKKSVTIDVTYNTLPAISFIIDAFRNNGVIEIEPELEKRMRKDFIELFYLNPAEIAKLKGKVNLALQKKVPKNINDAKEELRRAMKIAINAQDPAPVETRRERVNRMVRGYIPPAGSVPTANNLTIRNGNGPEIRIRKRIGTIRKKAKNLRSIVNALKKGGRRTRRKSRK